VAVLLAHTCAYGRVTKIKKGPTSNGSVQATASASASPSASASATSFEPPVASFAVPTVDEIELNEGEAVIEEPVAAGGAPNYECYMRGMVKCGGDGITKAEGFWCASKEKSQDKSQTSKFEITHDGSDADGSFPLNSANYSGHFIMKVGATSRKKVAEKVSERATRKEFERCGGGQARLLHFSL